MDQLPPGWLLKYNHVLPQTNGAVFQLLSYLCPGTSYMSGVFILDLKHKYNKPLSSYRNIKSQDDCPIKNETFFIHTGLSIAIFT